MSAAKSQISSVHSTPHKWWRVKSRFLSVIILSVDLGAPDLGLAQKVPARQPLGLYARVTLSTCVDVSNDMVTASCVSNKVAAVLENPAISGVLSVLNWSDVCPSVPAGSTNSTVGTNDWAIPDAIFGEVAQWSAKNPTNIPKPRPPGRAAPVLRMVRANQYLLRGGLLDPLAGGLGNVRQAHHFNQRHLLFHQRWQQQRWFR
jgi:hypothetical protein